MVRAILRLARFDSALLGFLALFLPSFVRSHNAGLSIVRAMPLFFICICTFISNDLEDVDRDLVNHPDRPLPSRQIAPVFAVLLYFTCLGAALLLTHHYVSEGVAFWYYGLLTLAISYGYIVEYLPSLKPLYVAVASSIPVLIVLAWYPNESRLYLVAAAVFFLTAGREMCMDIKDRPGDEDSFIQKFNPTRLAIAAFGLQAIGLVVLGVQVHDVASTVDLIAMVCLLVLAGLSWFAWSSYRAAIIVMKLQFFVGLYFLT